MKIEVHVTNTNGDDLRCLEHKVDGIDDKVSAVLGKLGDDAEAQSIIDDLTDQLNASTINLQTAIRRAKKGQK